MLALFFNLMKVALWYPIDQKFRADYYIRVFHDATLVSRHQWMDGFRRVESWSTPVHGSQFGPNVQPWTEVKDMRLDMTEREIYLIFSDICYNSTGCEPLNLGDSCLFIFPLI
jgi:hypothetical protein